MVFLQGHVVSPVYAVKIYKVYGDKSISVLKENPCGLALDISGSSLRQQIKLLGVWELIPTLK
jgi:hypothetical protein